MSEWNYSLPLGNAVRIEELLRAAVRFVARASKRRCVDRCRCASDIGHRPVVVDIVSTEGEQGVKRNLQRKAEQADRMFTALVSHMNDALKIEAQVRNGRPVEVPAWLKSN